MSSVFEDYEPYKGDIATRNFGSLVAFETGEALTYGLFYAQDRGEMFVVPGDKVYAGMIVGANTRPGDIELNVCKAKHLTSIRNAAGAEDAMRLRPVRPMTLERALDFIDDDELVGRLLDIVTETTLDFVDRLAEVGVKYAYVADPVASLVSPAMYEELVLPRHRRIFSHMAEKGIAGRLHMCGNTLGILP